MQLLGITGRVLTPDGQFVGIVGAGKDEVAQRLVKNHGYTQHALADPIKRMLSVLPGMEFYRWDDREWKEAVNPIFGVTRRHMAQTLGTEWRDLICTDLWLKVAEAKWGQLQHDHLQPEGMVISDIRFPHEVEWLRRFGGKLVVVIRNNGVAGAAASAHSSEAGVKTESTDLYLYNTGTLPELYEKVDGLARALSGAITCE